MKEGQPTTTIVLSENRSVACETIASELGIEVLRLTQAGGSYYPVVKGERSNVALIIPLDMAQIQINYGDVSGSVFWDKVDELVPPKTSN